MNRTARCVLHALLVLFVVAGPGFAQTGSDFGLADGIRQVDEGEFDNAIVTLDTAARRLVADPKRVRELSQAYLYLGIAYMGKGHEAAAKAKFREALAGMKDLTLSAERYPPKVVDLFEAAREEARADRPATTAPAPAAAASQTKKKGGGKGLLVIGGLAVVGGGVAVAAGGGGGGSGSGGGTTTTTTTLPSQSLDRSAAILSGDQHFFVVTPTRSGSLVATVTWQNRNLRLDLGCQEQAPPYNSCGGTYNRTSDTTGQFTAQVSQKEYLLILSNYNDISGAEPYTLKVVYP